MQLVLKALWERLQAVLGALAPKKEVGVENRFYFDETEKIWKLRGGETEQERAESEAIRFHTSRGLSDALAPPTTACDASRAGWAGEAPPPPPTSGPVPRSMHGGPGAGAGNFSALAHPVYAPAASFAGDAASAGSAGPPPPPRAPARPVPGVAAPQALTSPFGPPPSLQAGGPTPLASPFGNMQQQAPAAPPGATPPLASPFGATPATGAAAPGAAGPLASPFGAAPAAEAPALAGARPGAPPAGPPPGPGAAVAPGGATPLATPLQGQAPVL